MEVEMKIRGLMMDPVNNMPIVILKDINGNTVLPIWVGVYEANAIALEIEKVQTPRPMTHDLLKNVLFGLNVHVQKVVVKDPANKQQIALIQSHLKEESERFRKGDFSDPAKIHGADMPGLAQLKAGAKEINVRYTALPDGAEIRYQAKDPKLVMAIHQWFSAQVSDHGHHAMGH